MSKSTRKSTLGTIPDHPQLENRLDLNEKEQAQLSKLLECRIKLTDDKGKPTGKLGGAAFPHGIAKREDLKQQSIAHLGLKWAPGFIVKNRAFQIPGTTGLYALIAHKGPAAVQRGLKAYLEAKGKEAPKASKEATAKPVKKAAASKKTKSAKKAAPVAPEVAAPAAEATA